MLLGTFSEVLLKIIVSMCQSMSFFLFIYFFFSHGNEAAGKFQLLDIFVK